MGYKHLNYSNSQIDKLKICYPEQQWDIIYRIFPNLTKKQIQKIAYQYSIKSNNPTHIKDISGLSYGELIVQSFAYTECNKAYWNCLCSCGKKCVVSGIDLRSGHVISCGHQQRSAGHIKKDKTGKRYGKLVIQKMIPNYYGLGKHGCLCKCDCGNERIIYTGKFNDNHYQKTCGKCYRGVKQYDTNHEYRLDRNEKIYQIYKHTAPNGKCYIGMTKNGIKNRSGNKGAYYTSQKKFSNAIKKYGWNNFTHEILESQLTHSEACQKEIYYINYFNSINNGYNYLPGGNGKGRIGKRVYQLSEDMKVLNVFQSESEAAFYLKPISHKTIANWCQSDKLINGYYWIFEKDYPNNIDISSYTKIHFEYLQFDPYNYLHTVNHSNAKKN